jgi:hypothetical protein
MFDNLKNLAGIMGQAKELSQKFEKLQEQLAGMTVEADAGAGAVSVTATGRLQIVSVRIDPAMLGTLVGEGSDADRQMVEDLIAAATNAALEKAQALAKQEMSKLTGGLNLPGLDKLLGG